MLQPYELLGVTYKSSIQDVRRAYYNWALICHPDKGGNKDEMHLIHNAYEWIMNQLTEVNKREKEGKTYEEYLEEQKTNIEDSKNKPYPSFDDIVLEVNNISNEFLKGKYTEYISDDYNEDKFQWFKRLVFLSLHANSSQINYESIANSLKESWKNMQEMSIPHGYGKYMTFKEETSLPSLGSKTICVIDSENVATNTKQNHGTLILIPKEMDDYGLKLNSLSMYDYKSAYTEYDPTILEQAAKEVCPKYLEIHEDIMQRLNELEITRKILDMELDNKNNVTDNSDMCD